jgi:hypothetical protein
VKRAWPLVILLSLSSSCLDFNTVVQQYCDSGTSPACPEINCANGLDDDGDQLVDCEDPDCQARTCHSDALCMVAPVCLADGGCGGQPKQCNMPPAFCLAVPGTCDPGTGACSYDPDPTGACDDSNACTSTDLCSADGGCGGNPVTCNTPPSVCFGATTGCDPIRGCLYQVQTGTGCNDSNACTFNDGCAADGGCSGTAYMCSNSECISSACLGDGGCSSPVLRTGQPCDAGLCLATGACSTFPYRPANFDPAAIAARGIAPALTINCNNAWFNSADGGQFWCSGQTAPIQTVVKQDGGPDAVVLATNGLSVGSGGALALVGSRPVIFAVWGDATINGTISAASAASTGAGQNPAGLCDAQNGLADGSLLGGGGGGGSHGGRGGDGGDGSAVGHGGRSGSLSGNASIAPLRGGCPGGSGGRAVDSSSQGGRGGAGGGAVQISALGLLTVSGTVTASGAGGQGGLGVITGSNGGGGGGSGGAVLLEGQDVSMPAGGKLTANGGGGGGGGGVSNGLDGADGPPQTAAPAPGGSGAIACAGRGGQGGSAQGPAAPGEDATALCSAGGGGGGLGRVRVNGFGVCHPDAGVQSPAPTFGGSCP